MAISQPLRERIKILKEEYDRFRMGKDSLLEIIDSVELSESVYNSNAIENSTLTLKETEKILLEMELSRDISLREVFETKNLARVMQYVRTKTKERELTKETLLILHQMLMGNINDKIAGHFRQKDEYVRIGTYIASPPEHIERLINDILIEYSSNHDIYFADKIAKFHLAFEAVHPFVDGNGRIGRVIINYQLQRIGFPGIIIRDKEKQVYYKSFRDYEDFKNTKPMERIVALSLTESLHKRIAYLKSENIIPLTEYVQKIGKPAPVFLNAARRQTIPAFREKGVWKIGESFILDKK